MDIFQIIGPIMIGPSSSHTAGAVRIGNVARKILGEKPTKAVITLYNSFAETGEGHGTDKALLAGILGFLPDDKRIKNAFEEATRYGIKYQIEKGEATNSLPPNVANIILYGTSKKIEITGSSIGGGRIEILSMNGVPLRLDLEKQTIIIIHCDDTFTILNIIKHLNDFNNINITSIKSQELHEGKAITIIETDDFIPKAYYEELQKDKSIYDVVVLN